MSRQLRDEPPDELARAREIVSSILESGDLIERQLELEGFAAARAFEGKTKIVADAAKRQHQQTLDTFPNRECAEEVFGKDTITIDGADL